MENSDWVTIINPETKMDTGELFMTFKLLKRRYRSIEEDEKIRRLDYFNHPFEANSELKLIDDVDLPKPLSLESLATQFEPVETQRGGENVVEREDKSKKKKKKTEMDNFDDTTFNPMVSTNF